MFKFANKNGLEGRRTNYLKYFFSAVTGFLRIFVLNILGAYKFLSFIPEIKYASVLNETRVLNTRLPIMPTKICIYDIYRESFMQ